MKTLFRMMIPVMTGLALTFAACNNDDDEENNNNNTNACNYTTNLLVIGGTQKPITSSSCTVNATDYSANHYVGAGTGEGITLLFNGAAKPAAGTYGVSATVPVPTGKVYVEYFETVNAYQPVSGSVTVEASGAARVFKFCNLSFTNGSVNKVISARITCN
jgi:hypothetical protein